MLSGAGDDGDITSGRRSLPRQGPLATPTCSPPCGRSCIRQSKLHRAIGDLAVLMPDRSGVAECGNQTRAVTVRALATTHDRLEPLAACGAKSGRVSKDDHRLVPRQRPGRA